jgi:hypothetical protein
MAFLWGAIAAFLLSGADGGGRQWSEVGAVRVISFSAGAGSGDGPGNTGKGKVRV